VTRWPIWWSATLGYLPSDEPATSASGLTIIAAAAVGLVYRDFAASEPGSSVF